MTGKMIYVPKNRDNESRWIRVDEIYEEAPGFFCVTEFFQDGSTGGDILSKGYLIELANPPT